MPAPRPTLACQVVNLFDDDGDETEAARPPALSRPSSASSSESSSSAEAARRGVRRRLPSPPSPLRLKPIDYINQVWLAVLDVAAEPSPKPASPPALDGLSARSRSLAALGSIAGGRRAACSPASAALPYAAYEAFHLALHRALAPPASRWLLADGEGLARRNFAIDTHGTECMSRQSFVDALMLIARTWAEGLARTSPDLAASLRLLAAEARLPDDLETVFLASLARLIVGPAGAIRPWAEVELGCALSQGVIALLYSQVYGCDAEAAQTRTQSGAGAVPRPKSSTDFESSVSLSRRALHNRIARLLETRHQGPAC